MYQFVDTIEAGSAADRLPAEAMSINGVYIENEISGYRTLQVIGREIYGSEITEIEMGQSDGAQFFYRRNAQRNIRVMYQLISKSAEDFREKFNALNKILNQERAVFVFADEPDKHFIGTISDVEDVEGGSLNVTGEFTLRCSDPYKYGEQVEVTLSSTLSQTVTAEGEYETPCIIQITPLNDNSDLTITGIARDPITGEDEPVTIKNLKKSIPIIVDGETCTVTQQGANKYPETDFWEFPSLLPGENQITLSNAANTVTIKYRPRYI